MDGGRDQAVVEDVVVEDVEDVVVVVEVKRATWRATWLFCLSLFLSPSLLLSSSLPLNLLNLHSHAQVEEEQVWLVFSVFFFFSSSHEFFC